MGKNLIQTEDLTIGEVEQILNRATYFQKHHNQLDIIQSTFKNRFVANLFLEPSTRTRSSFEVAEKKLGLQVINFNSEASSIQKGETLYDTLKTLESMGNEAAVIRLTEEGVLKDLENKLAIRLVNAGEGRIAHPTQALLDLYTIKKYFQKVEGLKIAIIGDISHSRVARSNADILGRLGAHIMYSGPKSLMTQDLDGPYLPIDEAIKEADVVMMLRIQFERLEKKVKDSISTREEYNKEFGLTGKRTKLLQKHAIIMHPAPVNRGVEMDDSVVEHPKSKIFEQIHHGVWIRMAVIERALGAD